MTTPESSIDLVDPAKAIFSSMIALMDQRQIAVELMGDIDSDEDEDGDGDKDMNPERESREMVLDNEDMAVAATIFTDHRLDVPDYITFLYDSPFPSIGLHTNEIAPAEDSIVIELGYGATEVLFLLYRDESGTRMRKDFETKESPKEAKRDLEAERRATIMDTFTSIAETLTEEDNLRLHEPTRDEQEALLKLLASLRTGIKLS